jgi:hypothetical protein
MCAKLCNEEDNKQLKNSKLSLRRVSYLGQEGMPQNVRAEHPLLRVLLYYSFDKGHRVSRNVLGILDLLDLSQQKNTFIIFFIVSLRLMW